MENNSEYHVELIDTKISYDLKVYKVIIIGLTGVGKSSISLKLTNQDGETSPTISVDIFNFKVKVNETILQIQLWDSCGNEEFARNTPNLFKNTKLAIIVYAIDDKNSFDDVGNWINILNKFCPDCMKYLIGNKNDLEKKREVQKEEGEKIKKSYNFNYFLETSAESGFNIMNLLNNIAISIYKKEKEDEENLDEELNKGRITLTKEIHQEDKIKNKKHCC